LGRSYQIEVITNMVGGGVEAGANDAGFPVRATAIRGHLRHWWRLTAGRKYGFDIERLWRREEEIFGSTEFPSPLGVKVPTQPPIEPIEPNQDLAYALFASIANEQKVAKDGIRFELQLSWPDEAGLKLRRSAQNDRRKKDGKPCLPDVIEPIAGEIEETVLAWLTYGGLGGRTRRGRGSVAFLEKSARPSGLPPIDARIFVGPAETDAVSAWIRAIDIYRDFRQKPRGRDHLKLTPKGPETVPGRSHWPEADSIRKITGCALKPPAGARPSGAPVDEDPHDHSTPVVPPEALPSFPKAVLGMPIHFHFADHPGKNRPGVANKDPQDVQLNPRILSHDGTWEDKERMASPIITRPLWIDERWRPAVIVLNSPLPDGFRAKLKGKQAMAGGRDCDREVRLDQIMGPRLGTLEPLRKKEDAREALIEYLIEELHWEER
jgi:CRISPR-associated protein Cmr1